jgi:hypothetical protein
MMQVGHFYPYQAPQKALLDGRIKERKNQKPLVRDTNTLRDRVYHLRNYNLFGKTIKTSEKIVNQRTNDEQVCSSVLSCNHLRLGEGQKA